MWKFIKTWPFFTWMELPVVTKNVPDPGAITAKNIGYNLKRQRGIRQWFHRRLGVSLTATYDEIEHAILSRISEDQHSVYVVYLASLKAHEQALKEKI